MSARTFEQAKREAARAIALSQKHAKHLQIAGMKVCVVNDFGTSVITATTSLPWQLGHGAWVINAGVFRAYDCGRVTPVENEKGAE